MELKIKRENVIVPIVSALLIVIISNLKIDWYFKTIMFPFFMVLVSSTILVMKNDDINKKAFYLLIPIILIIFSNLILILLKYRGFIQARNLLYYSRSTCEFSSSNGVLRPKILTITFSFFFSLFTSSIIPLNPLNGP